MDKKDIIVNWDYYFFRIHIKKAVPALLVLLFFLFLSVYWVERSVVFLFCLFLSVYFRELFFPVYYEIDKKEKIIKVENFVFRKKYDLKRYIKIFKWKNGLFLSTINKESVINSSRGLKLFVKEENKEEIFNILEDIIESK